MNSSNAIPEEWVPAVLEKASRLYQQQNQSYSLDQLQAAGSEVEIPPELMQQALEELKAEQTAVALANQRKKRTLKIGGFAAVGLAIATALWTGSVYNSLNAARSTVDGKWAQVENQMQRRADLIPQITQVAQGYAGHEKAVIESLGSARETFLSAQTIAERQAADEAVKSAIAQFQTFAASTQTLQSSELFINLQYEIAGTENRIATERMRYNQAVEAYNRSVRGFPTVLVAGPLGFDPQP